MFRLFFTVRNCHRDRWHYNQGRGHPNQLRIILVSLLPEITHSILTVDRIVSLDIGQILCENNGQTT